MIKLCQSTALRGRVKVGWSAAPVLAGLFLVGLLSGCATPRTVQTAVPEESREFVFGHDTFAFTNELYRVYQRDDETGEMGWGEPESPPTFSHHCFVLARSVCQFFTHARFAPELAKTNEVAYRKLIRQVTDASLRRQVVPGSIVIPGYANLFEFSREQEALLKEECGGAWQSYFQRGHWRMVLPFSRNQAKRMAEQLLSSVRQNRPAVVHLVRFPSLSINHSVVAFAAEEADEEIRFAVYDPNVPASVDWLVFNRSDRRFSCAANIAFPGGRVDVYEIYHAWNY